MTVCLDPFSPRSRFTLGQTYVLIIQHVFFVPETSRRTPRPLPRYREQNRSSGSLDLGVRSKYVNLTYTAPIERVN